MADKGQEGNKEKRYTKKESYLRAILKEHKHSPCDGTLSAGNSPCPTATLSKRRSFAALRGSAQGDSALLLSCSLLVRARSLGCASFQEEEASPFISCSSVQSMYFGGRGLSVLGGSDPMFFLLIIDQKGSKRGVINVVLIRLGCFISLKSN